MPSVIDAGRTHSSYVELLRARAITQPDQLAYCFLSEGEEVERCTFAEIERSARTIAAMLQRNGATNERCLLLYPPGIPYVSAFYGCLMAGAIAVPVYPPRMNRNLDRLLAIAQDSGARFVLTTRAAHAQISNWFDDDSPLSKVQWRTTDDLDGTLAESWWDPRAGRDTLAFLQYTSGSVGTPKGVMVSHGNLLHNQEMMAAALGHDESTVVVSWLPLYHDMGLIGNVLCSLYNGGPCYVMAPVDFLKNPRRWLEAVTRYRATFSGGPDFAYALCAAKVRPADREGLDLSSWRGAFNGSEPVRGESLNAFVDAFAPHGFKPDALFPCYGLAETTLFAAGRFRTTPDLRFSKQGLLEHQACAPEDDQDAEPRVSCGTCPLGELRVVDPDAAQELPEGQVGEIWLASDSVAQGYWGQEERTRETFGAALADSGRGPYLRTGDLGFLVGGELYVTGRLKDLIILHGKNHYPHDIEVSIERSHPALRPGFSAAFSIEEEGSERLVVVAEVEREKRHGLDAGEVFARMRQGVALDHGVQLWAALLLRPGELPKTSSGKTQRGAARQRYLSNDYQVLARWRREAPVTVGPGPSPRLALVPPQRLGQGNLFEHWLVLRLASKLQLPPSDLDVHQPLAALGVESLTAAELVADVEEELGVRLDEEELFTGEPTIAQLARRLEQRTAAPAPPAATAPPVAVEPDPEEPLPHRPRPYRPPAFAEGSHPFLVHVNPELGRTLMQLKMDRVFVRGEGCYLYDREGTRYLDFLAQYGALPFGFNPPRIWQALLDVRDRGEPSFVQPSALDAAGELARRLLRLAPPGLAYVTFANSGAEAIEAAIKLCRSTTGRRRVLAAENGFHGKTMGALSATGKAKYQKPFGLPFGGFDYVPYGDLDALRQALAARAYAGFLVEPVQGEGGIIEPPVGYLRQAWELCRESGTLFVADEIQTGLGRTGAMFACLEEGITPDVMTVAKALGGGLMPIGACLATREAYNEEFALRHTSTFAGNALACRAAIATLDLLEEDDQALVRQVAANGGRLKRELLTLMRLHPDLVSLVRGRGFMLGLRFGLDRYNGGEGLLGYLGEEEHLTALMVSYLLEHERVRVGYTLNQGGVMRIQPPLIATWQDCEVFLAAFERALAQLARRSTVRLTAHLAGVDPHRLERTARQNGEPLEMRLKPRCPPRPEDGRFAFLVHPLTLADYAELDPSLEVLSREELQRLASCIADNFDPFVVGETRIVSDEGKAAYGEFIVVPRTARELSRMPPEDALDEVRKAAELGVERGARILGLGAFASVVTHGGLSLKKAGMVPLTTGNSYTAAASHQALRLALEKRGQTLRACTVAVLGATGSIGRALSRLLCEEAGRLVLLGNPGRPEAARKRMLELSSSMLRRIWQRAEDRRGPLADTPLAAYALSLQPAAPPAHDAVVRELAARWVAESGALHLSYDADHWLPQCDVVVTATSSVDGLVESRHLKEGAVVCDISRPTNVSPEVRCDREDVLVVDGGVVELPRGSALGLRTSLEPGRAYACMAETILLALEKRYEDTSLGFDLDLDTIFELGHLAERHGLTPVLHNPPRLRWQLLPRTSIGH